MKNFTKRMTLSQIAEFGELMAVTREQDNQTNRQRLKDFGAKIHTDIIKQISKQKLSRHHLI